MGLRERDDAHGALVKVLHFPPEIPIILNTVWQQPPLLMFAKKPS